MKVKDIMTTNVTCVNPSTSVIETARLMQQHNIGSIPVCDNNGIVGIVTDRDIVIRNIAQGKDPNSTIVKDVMTSAITTVSPEMEVDDISRKMASSQIRRLPVVDNNKVVGIVALGDVATQAKYDAEIADTLLEISKPTRPQNQVL